MCILFIYRNPNPPSDGYRLILISNRDEYYARPAKSAHFWEGYPQCFGGTDMEPGKEGGSWLALSIKTGRIGVLLNLNGTPKSLIGKGRGFLIRDYLISAKSTVNYATELHKFTQETQSYNPYNLVMVDLKKNDIYYLSSIQNYPGPKYITEEISGFGNSGIEKPYKKVLIGKKQFEQITHNASTTQQEKLIDSLLHFLKQDERHLPDDELKKRSPQEFNELSSIFVHHAKAKYGTRTHSIILVNSFNQVTFIEDTLETNGLWTRQIFFNNL